MCERVLPNYYEPLGTETHEREEIPRRVDTNQAGERENLVVNEMRQQNLASEGYDKKEGRADNEQEMAQEQRERSLFIQEGRKASP